MQSRKTFSFRAWVFFLLLLAASLLIMPNNQTAVAGENFADGQLFSNGGQQITIEEFIAKATGVDYILIGENHDAQHHHQMQARLLEALAQKGLRPAVGFEMLYSRNQNLLTDFNKRESKLNELEEVPGWSQSWSYPFAIYAPIFQVAEQFNLPVYGLNISKATLDLIKANGFDQTRDTVPEDERPDLPAEVIWPMPEQVEALTKLREGFSGLGMTTESPASQAAPLDTKKSDGESKPAADQKRFLLVQSLWDTSMAESAVKAHKETGQPVVIIAGSGHVANGHGIAHRLKNLDPDKKIMLVVPLAHPFADNDDRKKSADVFFASRPSILSLGLVLKAEPNRIIVDEIKSGSRAEAAGLKTGDQILNMEEKEMKNPGAFHSAIAIADLQDKRKGLTEKREKALTVERNGEKHNLTLN